MVNIDSDLNPHCNQQCNLYYYYYFPLIYFCYQCVMKAYQGIKQKHVAKFNKKNYPQTVVGGLCRGSWYTVPSH